ncbi:MAG: hypothetical protein K2Q22_07575, partial [Cytophagales bacterium]|nr:hypothetical protein [Cytophagales bacterium]
MKKHILTFALWTIALCQVSVAQIATITTSSWSFSSFDGNNYGWQINVPGVITDNLTITAYYFGDFSSPQSNNISIYGYNSNFGTLTASGGCITTPLTKSFVMTKEEALASLESDGYVYLEADLSNGVNDPNCTNSGIYFVVNAPNCETTIPGFKVPTITILSPGKICPIGLATLTVSPSGGQFSGPYITNNQFDAQAAGPGSYKLKYSFFDSSVGCRFTANKSLIVYANAPVAATTQIVCNGVPFSLTATGPNLTWYNDYSLGQQIGVGTPLTLAGISTSRSYVTASKNPIITAQPTFSVVTFTGANYATIDHNALTDDDRAGVITTKDFVYV